MHNADGTAETYVVKLKFTTVTFVTCRPAGSRISRHLLLYGCIVPTYTHVHAYVPERVRNTFSFTKEVGLYRDNTRRCV